MPTNTVTDYLLIWKKHFDNNVPKTRRERFWVACHGTNAKWGVLTGVAVFTLSSLDGIMARSDLLDASPTLRFVSGIYACTWGVYLFGFKADLSLRLVDQLLRVAFAVESERHSRERQPETQAILHATARRVARYLTGMNTWSGFVFVAVLVPALLNHVPANPSWPPPTTPLGYWSLFMLHIASTIFLPVGYFPLIAFLYGVLHCCGALLQALGELLERAGDEEELREAVLLSAELNKGLAILNTLFHTAVMHVLQSTLMMPLVATCEVLNGRFDPFLLTTGPLNVVIFIPLCFAGQSMETTSAALLESTYRGRWLEESRRGRALRLQVMQRAGRPTQLTSRELGAINLALCQNALRKWFSFLNFLLSTS